MPEIFENSENQETKPIISPDTEEFLRIKQNEGEKRVNINHEGIDKRSRDTFASMRHEYEKDSESGMHMEAGIPLPLKVKDEKQAVELVSKLIDAGDGDGNELTEFLDQNMD